VERDLKVTQREARIVFEIKRKQVTVRENADGKLNIIAIHGEGSMPRGNSQPVESLVLLDEIGLGRAKSFHATRSGISERRKNFDLSPEQYLAVAPLVFAKILELATQKVASWTNPTFVLPTPRLHYSRHQKRLFASTSFVEQPRGVRFCFDLRDEKFANDLYWAELHANVQVARQINGLAKFIDLCLKSLTTNGRTLEQFRKLKTAQPALEALRERAYWPRHLLLETLTRPPLGVHHPHFFHLADHLEWDLSPTEARARAEKVYPKARVRLGGIQVRINREKQGEYLMIELYPPFESKIGQKVDEEPVPF
jgi:hypothetical protein